MLVLTDPVVDCSPRVFVSLGLFVPWTRYQIFARSKDREDYMGGTLTRDEWLKICETIKDAPRGVGNVVIPLAHQMTEEQRLGKTKISSAKDARQKLSDLSRIVCSHPRP
jgi:hypothetical protein